MKIYKIMTADEWLAARQAGQFTGSVVDRMDGYIHFSTASQVRETAARHFAAAPDLMLLEIDPGRLPEPAALRWEPSRGGDLFPHLYGALPAQAVVRAWTLPWDGTSHAFPESLPAAARDSKAP